MTGKPELYGGKMLFTQEPDSCNSGTQEIEFEVLDAGGGKYVLIKTQGWAFDTIDEFATLYEKVKSAFDFNDSNDE